MATLQRRKKLFLLARLWHDRSWDVQKVRIPVDLTDQEAEQAAVEAAVRAIRKKLRNAPPGDAVPGLVMVTPYRPLPSNIETVR